MAMGEIDPYLLMLIAQFEAMGMMGLGKLPDPTTGNGMRDLTHAKLAIDVLTMIENKTRGNLAADEERELRRSLTLLRLNYVEEVQRDQQQPQVAQDADPGAASAPAGTEAQTSGDA
jgi:hypothetical protein